MRVYLGTLLILLVFSIIGCISTSQEEKIINEEPSIFNMKLSSPDFEHGKAIPSQFTCDGDDKIPALRWDEIPNGTQSFALIVIDPDAPMGEFIHWMVHDIPSDVREILQGDPVPGVEVQNDFGKTEYGGPCPPTGVHRYFFTLYALDVPSIEGADRINFVSQCENHVLGKAVLMGTYQRK